MLPPGLTIRTYELRDHDEVWRLHLEGVLRTTPEYRTAYADYEKDLHAIEATYLGEGAHFWVIEAPEGLVAMTAIQRVDAETARLRRMRVTPTRQRQGLAQALLDNAIAFCRGQNYTRLILDTTEHQSAAHKLYEKAGFTFTGRRMLGPFEVLDYELDLRSS